MMKTAERRMYKTGRREGASKLGFGIYPSTKKQRKRMAKVLGQRGGLKAARNRRARKKTRKRMGKVLKGIRRRAGSTKRRRRRTT